jgi:hypothetical protein
MVRGIASRGSFHHGSALTLEVEYVIQRISTIAGPMTGQ